MTFISETTVTARKPHRCEACGGEIPIKTEYVRYVGLNDGAYTLRYHVECRAEELRLNRRWDRHADEWMSLDDDVEGGGLEVLQGYAPIVAFRMLLRAKQKDDYNWARIESFFVERIADLTMEVADWKTACEGHLRRANM